MNSNSTTFVKTAINIFIAIAIGISLYQELDFSTGKSTAEADTQAVPEINVNGTKVEGLAIITTDKYKKQFKDLLIEKDYNIEIKEYPFEGVEYWINLFLTHGHMIVVFFLVSRYQAEQDQSKKTKLMIFGMVLVFGWMFLSPQLKTQRLGLEYKGVRVYQREDFQKAQLIEKITAYEEDSVFGLDPLPEPVKAKPQPVPAPEIPAEQSYTETEQPMNDF